jgi:hypothetical protein
MIIIDQSIYKILLYLYTYSTESRFRYKYSNVIPISQSYLSHMYHGCVSPIVLKMRVKCHWLTIIKNALGAQHHQAYKRCVTACSP